MIFFLTTQLVLKRIYFFTKVIINQRGEWWWGGGGGTFPDKCHQNNSWLSIAPLHTTHTQTHQKGRKILFPNITSTHPFSGNFLRQYNWKNYLFENYDFFEILRFSFFFLNYNFRKQEKKEEAMLAINCFKLLI